MNFVCPTEAKNWLWDISVVRLLLVIYCIVSCLVIDWISCMISCCSTFQQHLLWYLLQKRLNVFTWVFFIYILNVVLMFPYCLAVNTIMVLICIQVSEAFSKLHWNFCYLFYCWGNMVVFVSLFLPNFISLMHWWWLLYNKTL